MGNVLHNFFRRYLYRYNRYGADAFFDFIKSEMTNDRVPVALLLKVAEYLTRNKHEIELASSILSLSREYGIEHPLLVEVQAKCLWALRPKMEAIEFLKAEIANSEKSYLYELLGIMYGMLGDLRAQEKAFKKANERAIIENSRPSLDQK